MNIEKIPYTQYEEYIEVSKPESAGSVIRKYLYHWPLFVVVLLLTCTMAFLYMKFSTPGYTVRARLLIKDDIKGNGAEPALQELNLFKSRTLVENELEVLKSRALMAEVVKDLKLDVSYLEAGKYKSTDLYGQSPVQFVKLKPALNPLQKPYEMEIIIKDKQHFTLKQNNSVSEFAFSAILNNKLGKWRLDPAADVQKYIGKTIKIVVNDPNGVTDAFGAALSAELSNKKSTVVELSIKEKVPQRGQDVLNRLIKGYNYAAIAEKSNVRNSTLRFIDERLSSLTGELNSAERNVESFKSSNALMDISSESKFVLDRVRDNDLKLNEVNVQLEVVNGIEDYVNSDKSGNAPATAGITDAGLVALINQLIALELQKDQMLGTTPAKSPVFETVNRQISSTKRSIRENISGLKSSLITSQRQLRNYNSGFEASIRKLPGQERELLTKKRQQSIKEELYVYLLQKREEADVSYAATIADNRLVDQAYVGGPDSPNGKIVYGMAMVAGLVLPLGFIIGRNVLNNKVLTAKEIKEATAVPVLGELVYQKTSDPIVIKDKSRQMIAEQFRSLNTNLQHVYRDSREGRVTLLTSGISGEGKSFIACNLAASFAASGRKTIILEFDLRSPMIAKKMGIKADIGLSDYLDDNANIEEIIQPSPVHKNLFVAPSGSLPDFPTELLQRPKMQNLMDWLTLNFDEVLIDTPPIQLVADAMVLSQFSDVNLYVMRQGVTLKSQLEYVKQINAEQTLKNLSVVFNGINIAQYGGSYHYGYYANGNVGFKENFQVGTRNFFNRF